MKLDSVISKINKRMPGVTVHNDGRKHWFAYEGKIASFYTCEYRGTSSFHIRRENDRSDMMTDYFAGSFYDNATQMINALCPPEPKFSIGSLVKYKDNKRTKRHGNTGRMGLVTQHTAYGAYRLLMSDTGEEELYSYERDLEKVR